MNLPQFILRSDSCAGESLDVKKTDDVAMPDKSNQPLVESKSGGAVEENVAGNMKPFQLMKRDSAGLQGQARNIGWKPSEQSKREEVSALQNLAVAG